MRFNVHFSTTLSVTVGKYLIDLEFNPFYWRFIHKLTKDRGIMITQLGPVCIYIIDDEKSSEWIDRLVGGVDDKDRHGA